jgi:endonuclease III
MKFQIGDIANGQETSKVIIEDMDYVEVLEMMVKDANLYCKPADKEAESCVNQINDFCRENNRILGWED